MNKFNAAGAALIIGGAAFVGAMSGWELGPYRFDFTREQLATIGAGIGIVLSMGACGLAMERSEAQARSRATVRRLSRFLFQGDSQSGIDCSGNDCRNDRTRAGQGIGSGSCH